MNTETNNKLRLRKWGRKTIQLSNAGVLTSIMFSILWIAILIWSAEGSQWKIASTLGAATSIISGLVFVAIRRRLIAFSAILASDFAPIDQ